jgi:hypothetical protein
MASKEIGQATRSTTEAGHTGHAAQTTKRLQIETARGAGWHMPVRRGKVTIAISI